MLDNNKKIIRNGNNDDNTKLVNYIIKKYNKQKGYTQVKNISINIKIKENIYKLIRLNDEQFHLLYKNSISILEDYEYFMHPSLRKDTIYSNFSKMYIALTELFGKSGKYYDDWKSSFSFPFIIHFQKGEEEFEYLMNLYNYRSSIKFEIAKLIYSDDNIFKRDILHNPLEEFPRVDIRNFISFFVGFLTGYFESINERYDKFFFKIVQSNHILFGYKDGRFFDNEYEKEEEFNEAIQELKKYHD